MNYYIQGDAANADKINAAFEKLGYNTRGLNFSDGFFYTVERDVHYCIYDYMVNFIKTHPDYKELELPAQPKFKVGDWVVIDNCHNSVYQVDSVREYNYMLKHTHGGLMPFPFSSETLLSLWTIADAKDGDVLTNGTIILIVDHFGTFENRPIIYSWYFVASNKFYGVGPSEPDRWEVEGFHPATKEQRDLLLAKMKEAGYTWDEKKKELRKIQHYDISNFKPFQKVLVRQDDSCTWGVSFFGRYAGMFMCCNNVCFIQCIPFEGNEHLLGTTDMPSEEYINW